MLFCTLAGVHFNWSWGIALAAVLVALLRLIFACCVDKHRREPQEPERRPLLEAEGNKEAEHYGGLDAIQVPEDLVEGNQS